MPHNGLYNTYKEAKCRSRFGKLFRAEELEKAGAKNQLADQSDPEPVLAEWFSKTKGKAGEGRSRANAIESVGARYDGTNRTHDLCCDQREVDMESDLRVR